MSTANKYVGYLFLWNGYIFLYGNTSQNQYATVAVAASGMLSVHESCPVCTTAGSGVQTGQLSCTLNIPEAATATVALFNVRTTFYVLFATRNK